MFRVERCHAIQKLEGLACNGCFPRVSPPTTPSTAGCFKFGFLFMAKLYIVPYWINVMWLDVVTYLHHTDKEVCARHRVKHLVHLAVSATTDPTSGLVPPGLFLGTLLLLYTWSNTPNICRGFFVVL